jgi:hypothetical protein
MAPKEDGEAQAPKAAQAHAMGASQEEAPEEGKEAQKVG